MEEPCYHICCSEPAEHYVFLCLSTVHTVYVCVGCQEKMKEMCNLVYELSVTISSLGVPNPLTQWTCATSFHVLKCSSLRLLMKYLLEILEQLEVKISTRWPSYTYIEDTISILNQNLLYVEHQRNLENS